MKVKIAAIFVLALLACSSLFLVPGSHAAGSGSTENVAFAEAMSGGSHILSVGYSGVSQPFSVGSVPVSVSWITFLVSAAGGSTSLYIGTSVERNNILSKTVTVPNDQSQTPSWVNVSISPALVLNSGTYYLSTDQYYGEYEGIIDNGSWLTSRNIVAPMFYGPPGGNVATQANSSYMAFAIGGFVPVYNVTFQIPNALGSLWTVDFGGSNQSSSSSSIIFTAPNGTYRFAIPDVTYDGITYVASPDSGTVTVSGSTQLVEVSFIGQVYSVTFNESGLPAGTDWWLNITNGPSMHTNNSAISFKEPNGFIYFTAAAKGYSADPSSGTLPISGKNVSISLSFQKITNGTGTIIYNNNTIKNYFSQNWPLFVLISLIFLLTGWALTYFINPENRGKKKK